MALQKHCFQPVGQFASGVNPSETSETAGISFPLLNASAFNAAVKYSAKQLWNPVVPVTSIRVGGRFCRIGPTMAEVAWPNANGYVLKLSYYWWDGVQYNFTPILWAGLGTSGTIATNTDYLSDNTPLLDHNGNQYALNPVVNIGSTTKNNYLCSELVDPTGAAFQLVARFRPFSQSIFGIAENSVFNPSGDITTTVSGYGGTFINSGGWSPDFLVGDTTTKIYTSVAIVGDSRMVDGNETGSVKSFRRAIGGAQRFCEANNVAYNNFGKHGRTLVQAGAQAALGSYYSGVLAKRFHDILTDLGDNDISAGVTLGTTVNQSGSFKNAFRLIGVDSNANDADCRLVAMEPGPMATSGNGYVDLAGQTRIQGAIRSSILVWQRSTFLADLLAAGAKWAGIVNYSGTTFQLGLPGSKVSWTMDAQPTNTASSDCGKWNVPTIGTTTPMATLTIATRLDNTTFTIAGGFTYDYADLEGGLVVWDGNVTAGLAGTKDRLLMFGTQGRFATGNASYAVGDTFKVYIGPTSDGTGGVHENTCGHVAWARILADSGLIQGYDPFPVTGGPGNFSNFGNQFNYGNGIPVSRGF